MLINADITRGIVLTRIRNLIIIFFRILFTRWRVKLFQYGFPWIHSRSPKRHKNQATTHARNSLGWELISVFNNHKCKLLILAVSWIESWLELIYNSLSNTTLSRVSKVQCVHHAIAVCLLTWKKTRLNTAADFMANRSQLPAWAKRKAECWIKLINMAIYYHR